MADEFDRLASDVPRRVSLTTTFIENLVETQEFLSETDRCLGDTKVALAILSSGIEPPVVSKESKVFRERLEQFLGVVDEYQSKLLSPEKPKASGPPPGDSPSSQVPFPEIKTTAPPGSVQAAEEIIKEADRWCALEIERRKKAKGGNSPSEPKPLGDESTKKPNNFGEFDSDWAVDNSDSDEEETSESPAATLVAMPIPRVQLPTFRVSPPKPAKVVRKLPKRTPARPAPRAARSVAQRPRPVVNQPRPIVGRPRIIPRPIPRSAPIRIAHPAFRFRR